MFWSAIGHETASELGAAIFELRGMRLRGRTDSRGGDKPARGISGRDDRSPSLHQGGLLAGTGCDMRRRARKCLRYGIIEQ